MPWSGPMEGKSSTKRSDRQEGRGVRTWAVIAVLAAALLIGVALFLVDSGGGASQGQPGLITTVSATGLSCDDPSMPQAAQQVEREPAFASLSAGLCYDYLGQNTTTPGATVLSFAYYNGTLVYPCGVSPLEVPQSVIQYTLEPGQSAGSLRLLNSSAIPDEFYPRGPCPADTPVRVVSVTDVGSLIPAVPQLNLTVSSPVGGPRVTSLEALLTLNGGAQRFGFGVSPSNPLPQGVGVSAVVIVTGLNFTADQVYPMTLEGTLSSGATFDYSVQIQVADVP
jgi:hypothetical protein